MAPWEANGSQYVDL